MKEDIRIAIIGLGYVGLPLAVEFARKFKVIGLGLVAIASKFNVTGDPIRNNKFHLELGNKVYKKQKPTESLIENHYE